MNQPTNEARSVKYFSNYYDRRNRKNQIECIIDSKLFCLPWINQFGFSFTDIKDAAAYYLDFGVACSLQPNPLFCPDYYLRSYSDVKEHNFDPFIHFIVYGLSELRNPHPLFDTTYYLEQLKKTGSETIKVNPLLHYFDKGVKLGLSPHPLFNLKYYQSQNLPILRYQSKSSFKSPVIEYLEYTGIRGVDPHPLFDAQFYLSKNGGLRKIGLNPLEHYLIHGWAHRGDPHPLFHADWYLWMNPDVHQNHINPLLHYVTSGEKEERSPSPFFNIRFYRELYLDTHSGDSILESPLEHFATIGWKLGYNPSPLLNMSAAVSSTGSLKAKKFPALKFEQLLLKPDTAISPELYFSLVDSRQNPSNKLSLFLRIKQRLLKSTDKPQFNEILASTPSSAPSSSNQIVGLNYFGPFQVVSGLGEAARGYFKALNDYGILCQPINTEVPNYQKQIDFHKTYTSKDWDLSLAHINPDGMYPFLNSKAGRKFLSAKTRLGFWVWELPSFQAEWFPVLATFDEILTPSTFCQKAFLASSNLPVKVIPHIIEITRNLAETSEDSILLASERAKKLLNIPADKFCYLYIFDASSYIERKNPFALIEAFSEIVSYNPKTHLILKISYGDTNLKFQRELSKRLSKLPKESYSLIEDVLDRSKLNNLFEAANCYVSPHRSEGFGLTLAESLAHGAPVVATNFGGTVDFLNHATGYPVNYTLKEIESDIGPYKKGNYWAEIDQDDLINQMLRVLNNPREAFTKTLLAQKHLNENNSYHNIGKLFYEVLNKYN